MSLAKSEMTSKSVENSNTEEQLKEQAALSDSGLFKTGGTKPKDHNHPLSISSPYHQPLPTHQSSAELPNIISNRPYIHRSHANPAYFVSQWDHSFNQNKHLNGSPMGPLNREHNRLLTKFQTKICDHWRRSGTCSYGDACWYAHGEDDLRKLNSPKSGRTEEKTTKENEKPVSRRSPIPAADDFIETTKTVKSVEEPKESKEPKETVVVPTKRASTNVKGLTVTIPANIAFKSDQVSTNSLPLSPAQERWISMSCGGLPNEKIGEPANVMNEFENEFEKKQTLENAIDKRTTGQFVRNEDFEKMPTKQDEFGLLSPNTFPWNRLNPNSHMHSQHHRSFSRGPHQRVTHGAPSFPGMPNPTQLPPAGQHQSRISRSASSVFNSGFEEPRQFVCPNHPNALSRTSRDHPQMSHNVPAPQPQIQQACWNLAGDLFQRQKDIETSGVRSIYDSHAHPMTRKFDEFELSRLIAQQQQQQQKKQELLLEYETKKLKDLAMLRYQIERGVISKSQVPNDLMNELMRNLPLLDQHFPLGVKSQGRHECPCTHAQHKRPSEHVSLQSQYAQSRQPNLTIQQLIQQQQHLRRYGMSAPVLTDLQAPPKIFESLLPHDDSFSIWLDPKPKKESMSAYARAPARQVEQGPSLLAKMEVLRAERFPISEEEIALSTGPPRSSRRYDSSGGSSPIAMSLMELLGNDKLVPKPASKPKTTMFDFDSLKISETLTMTPQSSRHTSTSGKSDSPKFFVNDEKSPNFDDVSPIQTGLFTPLTASNPTFTERCDFFAASGSCPFGDGCHLSHAIPDQQKQELNAL